MSRSNKKYFNSDDIFNLTNDGYDIWQREINKFTLTKNIISPFRSEKNPSFRIKRSTYSGLYIGIDYTTGKVYNGITLVQELYNLNFKEAIEKIVNDLGLKTSNRQYTKVLKEKSVIIPSKPILYEYTEIKFQKRHHKYWNAGELTEDFLNKNGVYAASKIAINKKVVEIPEDEMCFVYIPEDLEYGKLKILRLGDKVEKKDKWRSNIPRDYFFFENPQIRADNLFIAKSNKDALINKLLGYSSLAVMSENAYNFIENYPNLKQRFIDKDVDFHLNWGIDQDALEKTELIKEELNIEVFKLPLYLNSQGINDNFEYVKKFGLKKYELQIKNYLTNL